MNSEMEEQIGEHVGGQPDHSEHLNRTALLLRSYRIRSSGSRRAFVTGAAFRTETLVSI